MQNEHIICDVHSAPMFILPRNILKCCKIIYSSNDLNTLYCLVDAFAAILAYCALLRQFSSIIMLVFNLPRLCLFCPDCQFMIKRIVFQHPCKWNFGGPESQTYPSSRKMYNRFILPWSSLLVQRPPWKQNLYSELRYWDTQLDLSTPSQ